MRFSVEEFSDYINYFGGCFFDESHDIIYNVVEDSVQLIGDDEMKMLVKWHPEREPLQIIVSCDKSNWVLEDNNASNSTDDSDSDDYNVHYIGDLLEITYDSDSTDSETESEANHYAVLQAIDEGDIQFAIKNLACIVASKQEALKILTKNSNERHKRCIADRLNESECPISLDTIKIPAIVRCCQNKFEFEKLVKSQHHNNSCPMCKAFVNLKDIIIIKNCISRLYLDVGHT